MESRHQLGSDENHRIQEEEGWTSFCVRRNLVFQTSIPPLYYDIPLMDIPHISTPTTLPYMKLFLDTADVNDVRDRFSTGLIAGVTTNPTLVRKAGKDPLDVYHQLADLGVKDISMEVVADSAEEMLAMGIKLADEFENTTTVKLPCSVEGLKACKLLKQEYIRTNVTLIFSPAQAILASLAGATYISPFVGRMDDNSLDGIKLINDITNTLQTDTQVLAASIRDPQSVSTAFAVGADICTIPPVVFDKMYKHILTDAGINQFNLDYAETSN